MLHHLLYVSEADRNLQNYELQEMLVPLIENNRRLDITGLLLYGGGHFMQLLEGEREVIEDLFERICSDPRHHDVHRLLTFPVENRLFDDWSMSLLNLDMRTTLEETCMIQLVDEARRAERQRRHTDLSIRYLVQFRSLLNSPDTPVSAAV
ncbi:MAG: BLUF domain-containing protein [Planctomycetota bacterium]